ncbi:MAG TPA: glycosyltransferase [Solirubrobacteraceae bacterium]
MRVAFDSRPAADQRGVGHYSRCLLEALRDTVRARGGEIVETHRPRHAYDVFHAPWMQGAMLHSPCPMVVTIHELSPLTRLSERLRGGGIHLRLRHLAVQRATHVIVPTEALAHEAVAELGFERDRVVVIPEATDPAADTASQTSPAQPAWTWQDVGRETWRVYESALARPERPCVGRLSRRRVVALQ